jgi:hypothetical protein
LALALAVAVAVAVGLAGCGDDSGRTEPAAGASSKLVPAHFASIPRYPDSTPLGSVTTDGGTTSRSFQAQGTRPAEVLDWYRTHLGGWTNVEPPHSVGSGAQGASRATWERGGATLRISSEATPELGPSTLQYSLVLISS